MYSMNLNKYAANKTTKKCLQHYAVFILPVRSWTELASELFYRKKNTFKHLVRYILHKQY